MAKNDPYVAEYREETLKLPLFITLVAAGLVAVPLAVWMFRINEEGFRSTDVTKYRALVETVSGDADAVSAMLHRDEQTLVEMKTAAPVVTLIVPEVVIVEKKENTPLNANLEGIYWSPSNPLVGIDGETYQVGDLVQGYKIIEIGKTSVRFKGPDGKTIVKDFYGDLFKK